MNTTMPNNQEEKVPTRGMLKLSTELDDDRQPMEVPVEIIDYKTQFGRTDYLVTPVGGKGEKWVSSGRIVPLPDA